MSTLTKKSSKSSPLGASFISPLPAVQTIPVVSKAGIGGASCALMEE
jgi:hypothetical protein